MGLIQPVGSRSAYRLGGSGLRTALAGGRISRKRGAMFVLADDAGRVLYSVDGRTWKSSATGIGGGGVLNISTNAGTVLVNDGANTQIQRVSFDGLRTWKNSAMSVGIAAGPSNAGYFAESTTLSRDGDGVAGTAVAPFYFQHIANDANGDTKWGWRNATEACFAPSLSTPPVLGGKGSANGTTCSVGALFGPFAYFGNSASGIVSVVDPSRGELATPSLGSFGGNYGMATNGAIVVMVGAAGFCAVLRKLAGGLVAQDWDTGVVGFTANALNVCLYNGEVFAAAGDGGVIGTSQDGVNWTAAVSGFANNFLCGCISHEIFV